MKLETDIKKIEELTRQNEGEDRRYRCLLEGCGLTVEEIDAIVHRHYRAVSEQIECRECKNCCKVFRPLLEVRDINRLADGLKIPREAFMAEYIVKYEDGQGHFFKLTPCPFLADNGCAVYADRPDVCRAYPNLLKTGFVSSISLTFSNCSVCPLVYNVYERVKSEICERRFTTLSSEDE